ncbi:MAG: ABC transporter ATP-binding protein [Phycisphaerae bacterium]|jgi:iron complex transport system ATP-binding protein
MSLAVEIENVSFAYTARPVLWNIGFAVEQGDFLAVAGPNGAGKSTLLNLICGQLRPSSGRIRIDGTDINSYSVKELARKVAVVRQEFVPAFDFTAAEIVAMARTPYMSAFGFETQADREIINPSLEATQTSQFSDRPIGQLSGGERQRVFIARALAQQSPILLLDEPTNFLDFKHQVVIYDLLKEAQRQSGKTIISVTHDINLAIQYCDKALLLSEQKYHIGNPDDVFTRQKIEEVFDVTTFEGAMEKGRFFMPLGKLAKDA